MVGDVLAQDLTKEDVRPGGVFIIHLLMEEQCAMPDKALFQTILDKHLNYVNCFGYSEETACFEGIVRMEKKYWNNVVIKCWLPIC